MYFTLDSIKKASHTAISSFLVIMLVSLTVWAQTNDSFNPNPDRAVATTVVQPNGKIMVGGNFENIAGTVRRLIARVNSDGSLDVSHNANGVSGWVNGIILQQNGGMLVYGSWGDTIGGAMRSYIARLNVDGVADASFNPIITGTIRTAVEQTDGKILIGGGFNTVNGQQRRGIARLNADGTLDTLFNPNPNEYTYSIAVQPDGKILFGGRFTQVNGVTQKGIARLNADGTLDTSFANPNQDSIYGISSIALQPDGKILVGSIFNNIGGQQRTAIARLNADGTLDASFNANAGDSFAYVSSIALQSDGKILVGGNFQTMGGQPRNDIARLNSNGVADSFNPNAGSGVNTLTLQPDGKLLAGGDFTFISNNSRNYLTRLNNDIAPVSVVTATTSSITLTRGGSAPALDRVFFDVSTDNGATYTSLGSATRIGATHNFTRTGLNLPFGQILIRVRGLYLCGASNSSRSIVEQVQSVTVSPSARTRFDFDGDGKADLGVYRPSNGGWYIYNLANGTNSSYAFGLSTDKIVPADYDGDGKTDVAVFRDGTWYLLRSQAGFTGVGFGAATDIPVPADFDGDGKSELAVFRPSNGGWYIYNLATNQFSSYAFGIATDRPVPADYDGDQKADIAVYRDGTWYIQRSQLGFTGIGFGDANDKAVPADYDGDGKTDVAVFRPSNGGWYLLQSTAGFAATAFGIATDLPTPADYDGDGKADIAVYRNDTWYLQRSQAGFTGVTFGAGGDRPVPNAFVR